jgi:DNA-binding XRE family transcriptional regulator
MKVARHARITKRKTSPTLELAFRIAHSFGVGVGVGLDEAFTFHDD